MRQCQTLVFVIKSLPFLWCPFFILICDCHCRGCGLRWCKCLPWLWWNLVLVAAASPSYRVSPEFDPQHVAYHQTFFPELRITANLFGGPTLRILEKGDEFMVFHGRHCFLSPAPWRLLAARLGGEGRAKKTTQCHTGPLLNFGRGLAPPTICHLHPPVTSVGLALPGEFNAFQPFSTSLNMS